MPQHDDFDAFPDEDFDASGFASEDDVNAPEYAAEGYYHFAVSEVDATGEKSPGAAFLTFEIITGNVPNQAGKTVQLAVWPPHPQAKDKDLAKKRYKKVVLRLMLALGLRKAGEFPKFRMNKAWWDSLEGKQCIGRVTHRKRKQTTDGGTNIEWVDAQFARPGEDLSPIGDKSVATVPVDKGMAEAGGYVVAEDI